MHRARILVVDDEPAIAQLAAAMLRRNGCSVETSCHPRDALERFLSGGGFDLVVSDFRMPAMNGCEMVAEMRRRKPDLRAVFMSGYVDEIVECECPVLRKPFRIAELVERVRQALTHPVPVCLERRISQPAPASKPSDPAVGSSSWIEGATRGARSAVQENSPDTAR